MKIAYFYNEEWETEYIKSKLPSHEFVFYKGTLAEQSTATDTTAEVLSFFVNSKIGPAEMDRFPALKLITTRSTGYDHIDLAEAKKRNILVVNVPSYGENTVAEFAFALLLCVSRKIYDSYNRIRETGSFSQEGLRGFDLKGKTIGIVGMGKIGAHSARMANGFEMNVIAYDAFPKPELAEKLGFKYVSLEELLKTSDVISVHAPLNKDTEHLINLDNVKLMKKGVVLINTARGPIIDTTAIVWGVKEEIIAGVGLDVLEEEGVMSDEWSLLSSAHPNEETMKTALENHYLIDHPNVIIAPHNAFNTMEALERILNTTIENIEAFGKGQPINIVASS